jgi:hypothetical protein
MILPYVFKFQDSRIFLLKPDISLHTVNTVCFKSVLGFDFKSDRKCIIKSIIASNSA